MISSRCLIILCIIICLCLSNFVAEGRKGKVISNDVVKTIRTADGVYDCVDFYKQPAFKHPSLKNHSFHPQMRPSFRPKWLKDTERSEKVISMDITLKGATCPYGTVPIRRFNDDDDQARQNVLRRQSYAQLGQIKSNAWSPSNIYFAIGQSKSDITKVYNGVASTLSIFNPHVERYQYSSGEIIIKGGNDAIITGWTVNPMVYKDNLTRFFVYTVSGNSHCMGSMCGFIRVRPDIPLDFVIKPISDVAGTIYILPFFVYQDPLNGNWWLEAGQNYTQLGFWPQQFFRGLFRSGTYVACGGEVYGPPNEGYPAMGSGYKPKSNDPEWSYCQNVQVVDESQNVVFKTDLEPFTNSGAHYDVNVYENGKRRYVFYGGPERY
ncbi:protein neprosin-like [Silene latifolia]|uniref:protein neprosin-like n=1 Tax=Silene latifolia TaxID=37657 RepID=UPI003D787FDA